MRFFFALTVLISLVAPAGAAPVHRSHARHHVVDPRFILGPDRGMGTPPGWYKFPGYPAIPPSENRNLDPSNFGGG